jgi:hypothetical protein
MILLFSFFNAMEETGISCSQEQLVTGTCKMNLAKVIGIRGGKIDEPMVFIQDIFLWATGFIGTVVACSIVIAGIKTILGNPKKGRDWLLFALIWLLLVLFSYTLIRLTQFIAKG